MASNRQAAAARRNVKQAQQAARSKRTIARLPKSTRSDMGKQGAMARSRHGRPGHRLEDRTRSELYEVARKEGIAGRSKMGKWELIDAIRAHR